MTRRINFSDGSYIEREDGQPGKRVINMSGGTYNASTGPQININGGQSSNWNTTDWTTPEPKTDYTSSDSVTSFSSGVYTENLGGDYIEIQGDYFG